MMISFARLSMELIIEGRCGLVAWEAVDLAQRPFSSPPTLGRAVSCKHCTSCWKKSGTFPRAGPTQLYSSR